MAKLHRDMAASVRARLLNLAKMSGRDFDALLLQYMQERFLYRLSISPYRKCLILKGAVMLLAYDMSLLRPTRDIDFLGAETSNDLDEIRKLVAAVASVEADDGVRFNTETVSLERITEDADYPGVRVKIEVCLTAARKTLQLDIGFGDVVVAGPVEMDFPALLEDQPSPNLLVYSRESAIAEKFEALVSLNLLTSRMKDIYDILFLAERGIFSFPTLRQAIMSTFSQRATPIEDRHLLFSTEFWEDRGKETQWNAFLRRNRLPMSPSLAEAMGRIKAFLEPVCSSTKQDDAVWSPSDWRWL